MNSLKGKNALVTGGGSGIGKAIAEELAAQGASLIIHYYKSAQPAEAVAAKIRAAGGTARTICADLSTEAGVEKLASFASALCDRLDVLVNNTGDLVARRTLDGVDMEHYRAVMAVNFDSALFVTKALLPLLKKSGAASVVNLSSIAGRKGGRSSLIYSSAKGAMLTLTRALSTELAPFGIRVNALAPGLILGSAFHEIHSTPESKQAMIKDIPLGRAGTCDDVARAAAFLASEYSGFITGATLDINGGSYMM
ncbi:MAG: 3-oxoacyl-acyl-carrier protein reductase [Spirochaetes bacterium]|nr:MAG: 3-oxoacyl-acyl-carrier protein reductase [Spirochaetota bacterium]